MTSLEDELRTVLRTQAHALRVPERPMPDPGDVELPRHREPRLLAVAACFALIAVGVVALAQRGTDDPEPARPVASVADTTTPEATVASVAPDTTVPAPMVNGWVALVNDDAIHLVRPGEDARRLEVTRSDSTVTVERCPAWSPDGTRLMFARMGGSSDTTLDDVELVIVPIGRDGTASAPTVIALNGFDVDGNPCGSWASDGRWVALRGLGEVWVVDTQTAAIRRLPDLRPTDLEWRPGTDELTIAGDIGTTRFANSAPAPVTVYSVSTGELRQLGSIEAGHIAWSPDGSTLAYTGVYEPSAGERPGGLWLVDADGTDHRLLVADNGEANHGIGPVWSPTGDRIVYQRLCCAGAETHEVVLVSVADGTETVIAPPQDGPDERARWYPFNVTWSPDGATLVYTAWRRRAGSGSPRVDSRSHVITVPVETPSDVTVLALGGGHQWGRQPG